MVLARATAGRGHRLRLGAYRHHPHRRYETGTLKDGQPDWHPDWARGTRRYRLDGWTDQRSITAVVFSYSRCAAAGI